MNTIQITNADGTIINYTSSEVLRFVEESKQYKAMLESQQDVNRKLRYKVRDFFGELEWSSGYDGGESTIYKDHVNSLLDSIGCDLLTSKYTATVHFTLGVILEAEREEDVEDLIRESISVDFYNGDVVSEEIDISDICQED